jgi:hypothetical protein
LRKRHHAAAKVITQLDHAGETVSRPRHAGELARVGFGRRERGDFGMVRETKF